MIGPGAQQLDHRRQAVRCLILRSRCGRFPAWRHMRCEYIECLRDLRYRNHLVDQPRHDRAAGHSVIGGLLWVLNDDQPVFLLHRP